MLTCKVAVGFNWIICHFMTDKALIFFLQLGYHFLVTWDCDPIFYLISASQTGDIWAPPENANYYQCINRSKKEFRTSRKFSSPMNYLLWYKKLVITNNMNRFNSIISFICNREWNSHKWLSPNSLQWWIESNEAWGRQPIKLASVFWDFHTFLSWVSSE